MQTTREIQNGCPNQACKQAGTKWPINQRFKKRTHGEKKVEKREETTTTTLSEKKEEASNASEKRDKG